MNAMTIGMYTHALLQQVYFPAVRCWGLSARYAEAFQGFTTFDMSEPFQPSLEDFPGAIGFIFQRPVYILADDYPPTIRMTIHIPGQIGFIDQREQIYWIWSN